ncbi:MAG: hypothetical protein WCA19_27500 [Candidatus Acidiferrales bacterium]
MKRMRRRMIPAIVALASSSRKQEKGRGHEYCNEGRVMPLELNRTLRRGIKLAAEAELDTCQCKTHRRRE